MTLSDEDRLSIMSQMAQLRKDINNLNFQLSDLNNQLMNDNIDKQISAINERVSIIQQNKIGVSTIENG